MADDADIVALKRYLCKLQDAVFEDCFTVFNGSQLAGNYDEWSDIFLLFYSYLILKSEENIYLIRRITSSTDSRIEPLIVDKLQ